MKALAGVRRVALALGTCGLALAARPAAAQTSGGAAAVAAARQLVLVTARGWRDSVGTLRRYERATVGAPWRAVGTPTPAVLGRGGIGWGAGQGAAPAGAPTKREGDGRSPAGAFALLHAFGFPAGDVPGSTRLPYLPLGDGSVCVDDPGSASYNVILDSASAARVDWTSAERMRAVAGYRLGVVVAYNGARTAGGGVRAGGGAAPLLGRGSCIFVHVWDGPRAPTAGCTALSAGALAELAAWLEPAKAPAFVLLTRPALAGVRRGWGLP